jgi:uncharacterized membrane protein YdjX (TVP38/TMEM64 family)
MILNVIKMPVYGVFFFLIIYAVHPLIAFPTWLLTVAAGFLYGTGWGLVYTLVGACASAIVSYSIGRYFAIDFSHKPTTQNLFQRYATYLQANTFEAVLILRLLFLPYDLLSYAAGFLRIRWQPFLLATLLGSLPGALSFTLFGAAFDGNFTNQAPKVDPRTLIVAVIIFAFSLGLSRWLKRRQPTA